MDSVDRIAHRFVLSAVILVALPGQAGAEPDVTGLRIGVHNSRTRVVLDLSGRVRFTTFVLSDPYRVVVNLPEIAWRLPARKPRLRGVVSAYRFGLFEKGTSRLVLDVRSPVRVRKAFVLAPRESRGYRLVLDLVKVSRASLLVAQERTRAQVRARRLASVPPPRPKRAKRSRTVIVIDPGHGGIDPGTIGVNGTWEKRIVLDYARALRRRLRASGRYEVYLTRNRDVFIPLRRRVRMARAKGADLFISLHADSMPNPRMRGAHVYTQSERASDKEAAALAAKENKSDAIAGVDLTAHPDGVANILIDLARRETWNQSAVFAKSLIHELSKVSWMIRKSHRFAEFAVLTAADVPSILVELGYLSNHREERLLRTRKHRKRVTWAMARSVDRYFARQQANRRP